MDKHQEYQQKRAEIFASMKGSLEAMPNTMTEESSFQYINGYLSLIEGAMRGDLSVQEDYLTLVIPPLKQQKLVSLGYSVKVLFVLNQALLSKVSAESAPWYVSFFADYAEKLCDVWESS
jgi:hypothetical protein